MAEDYVFFGRRSQKSGDIYGSSQLDLDTTRYFPWVYNAAAHKLGWQWWGLHLLEEWRDLPHLAAPPIYDREYNRLRGQERITWLAALRRICAGAFEGAILQDFDEEDEYYPLSITLQNDYQGFREDLFKAIECGLQKLDAWLSWREQSPSAQLLPALSVLHLEAEDGRVVVPYPAPEVEREYFKGLFEEFRLRLIAEPPAESWLRIMHSRFATLKELTLPEISASVEELPSVLPSMQWLNLSELPNLPPSPEVWLDLKTALATRVEWANKAVSLLSEALGLSKPRRKSTPVTKEPNYWQGIFRPGFTVKDLNNLLVSLGILESAEPLEFIYNPPPRQWVAIAHALRKASNVPVDTAVLYRAFKVTYGVNGIKVGGRRSFYRDDFMHDEASKELYDKTLALIRGRL